MADTISAVKDTVEDIGAEVKDQAEDLGAQA